MASFSKFVSTLFISYSNQDQKVSDLVFKKLTEMGYETTFRDNHPETGIPAGSDWEQEIYRKLRFCKALIVLCSKNWLESKWCFAELAYAQAMGKDYFPIAVEDHLELPLTIAKRQAVKMSDPKAWTRLRRGLVEAGLSPENDFSWPVEGVEDDCPYPGLSAFQSYHAGVYFGRDDEIRELREGLNQMASRRSPRMLFVVGASGSGKSSLVRAGLLPRLSKKSAKDWMIPRIFRWNELAGSGRTWQEQIALSLIGQWPEGKGRRPNWKDLTKKYSTTETNEDLASAFIEDTKDLLIASGRANAIPLLVIDQFEEMLSNTGEEVESFFRFLGNVMNSAHSPWLSISTIRTDFLSELQSQPEFADSLDVYSLPTMTSERLYEVIRGPAEKVGISFESDALVDQIVSDTRTSDALPLLAFALRELYEQFGYDKRFTFEEYRERLGGLEGCLARVANDLFAETAASPKVAVGKSASTSDAVNQALHRLKLRFHKLFQALGFGSFAERVFSSGKEPTSEDLRRQLLTSLSSHLVRFGVRGEKTEFVRRPAAWSEFDPSIRLILQHFVDKRLMTSRARYEDNPNSERVIEVAHEALFREWKVLADWLNERRDLLRWRNDIETSRRAQGENWSGLSGPQLAISGHWPRSRHEELTIQEHGWIDSAKRKLALRWAALALTTILFGLLAAFAMKRASGEEHQRKMAQSHQAQTQDILVYMLDTLVPNLREAGQLDLLQGPVDEIEKVAGNINDDQLLARALIASAQISFAKGRRGEANGLLENAREILETNSDHPKDQNSDTLEALAYAHTASGDLTAWSSSPSELFSARNHCLQAIELYQELRTKEENVRTLVGLGEANLYLGEIEAKCQSSEEPLRFYDSAIQYFEIANSGVEPVTVEIQTRLQALRSRSMLRKAQYLAHTRSSADAVLILKDLRRELLQLDDDYRGENHLVKSQLAETEMTLGYNHALLGNRESARGMYNISLRRAEALHLDDPANESYMQLLVRLKLSLSGSDLRALNERKRLANEAYCIVQEQMNENSSDWLRLHLRSLRSLGWIEFESNKLPSNDSAFRSLYTFINSPDFLEQVAFDPDLGKRAFWGSLEYCEALVLGGRFDEAKEVLATLNELPLGIDAEERNREIREMHEMIPGELNPN